MRACAFLAGLRERCKVEFAQAFTEIDQFGIAQLLAADADHQMIEQRLIHRLEISVRERPDIAARYFSAERRCQRFYSNGDHEKTSFQKLRSGQSRRMPAAFAMRP